MSAAYTLRYEAGASFYFISVHHSRKFCIRKSYVTISDDARISTFWKKDYDSGESISGLSFWQAVHTYLRQMYWVFTSNVL